MMKDRIKEIRKYFHLNQTDFGAKVGVKGNTIGNYEIGLRSPSDAVIFSICREFGVNEGWLRTGEGEMLVPKSRNDQLAAFFADILDADDGDFIRSFCSALASLNKEQLHKVAEVSEMVMNAWVAEKEKQDKKEKADL